MVLDNALYFLSYVYESNSLRKVVTKQMKKIWESLDGMCKNLKKDEVAYDQGVILLAMINISQMIFSRRLNNNKFINIKSMYSLNFHPLLSLTHWSNLTGRFKGQTRFRPRFLKFVQTFSCCTARPQYSHHHLLRIYVQQKCIGGPSKVN